MRPPHAAFAAIALVVACSSKSNVAEPNLLTGPRDAGSEVDATAPDAPAAPREDAAKPLDACDGGTRCGDACVDLQSDLASCGACGATCTKSPGDLTVACREARCRHVRELAQPSALPWALAVDATHVFWGSFQDRSDIFEAGPLRSCPKTGCALASFGDVIVDSASGSAFALDATRVYSVGRKGADNGVLRCPKTGCAEDGGAPEMLARHREGVERIAVDGDRLFLSTDSGVLISCPVSGCGPTGELEHIIAFGVWGGGRFLVDGDQVFLRADPGVVACKTAEGCGQSRPDPRTVVASSTRIEDFVLAGDHLYFTGPSAVYRCPKTGCGDNAAMRETISEHIGIPIRLAIANGRVYVAEAHRTDPLLSTIVSCPVAGCAPGERPKLVTQAPVLREMAVDDTRVYWTSARGLGVRSADL